MFKPYNPSTLLVHSPEITSYHFRTTQPPVYRASTVFFASTQDMRQRNRKEKNSYTYGLHGTPTTDELAGRMAILEGGEHCILAPSGLSAISLVNFAFLNTGDEVWLPDNVYSPNLELIQQLKQQFGVQYQIYNPLDASSFQPTSKTKLLWLEAAGSITLEFPDLCGLIKKANAAGVVTVLDNTWGAGLAFCPFDFADERLGVDISMHALTKYPSGGADILMGSIVTRQRDLHDQMVRVQGLQGIGVSGDDTERVIRGLPSLMLRYDQQDKNTRKLAHWLQQQPYFSRVLHPALPESAGHAYWQQVCGQNDRAAGLVSVVFKPQYNQHQVDAFCDALKLFKLGYSWGGPVSLVMSYQLSGKRQFDMPAGIVARLCIGLEDIGALQADLAQALQVLNHPA